MRTHTHDAARRSNTQRAPARQDQLQDLAAADSRRHWPGQAGFLLCFVIHVAFYGAVAWWVLGKPEIPIRWLQ